MIEKRGSEKICGTCKWHRREHPGGEWTCANIKSGYCAYWIDYKNTCDEWEGRN